MSYLILACHGGEEFKDSIFTVLKSRVSNVCDEVCKFEVPDSLKFGSFDCLIKLMDDLNKQDTVVEASLRRIERLMLELDPLMEFKVLFRQRTMTCESYIRSFQWDDTKMPRNRMVSDNLHQLQQAVSRIDNDVKTKAYTFTDIKTSLQNMTKQKQSVAAFAAADLIDILSPEIVVEGDFIEKEHIQTILVVVARGQEKEFLASYEKWDACVCPRSAKKFEKFVKGQMQPLEDKDGASLWRIVIFKKAFEAVRLGAKAAKCVVREFSYSVENYKAQQKKLETLGQEFTKQENSLKRHCAAAFSDTFVAWMHLKAMRVFVESVLRYGVPANFASFIVKPNSKNITKLRNILSDVFSASGLFGQSYIGAAEGKGSGEKEDGDDAYYPYVSLNLQPLNAGGTN